MRKQVIWIGSSLKDMQDLHPDVQDELGRAILDVQYGDTPRCAKALSGFGSASVMEIKENHDGSTYRAVYTAQLGNLVYILHVFQKKSHSGAETPKHEIDLIRARYKLAEVFHRAEMEGKDE